MIQQLDMFAMMAPPPPPPSVAELAYKQKCEAERIAWEAERQRIATAVAAGRAAGTTRTLAWGDATKRRSDWTKAAWLVEMVAHDGAVYARYDTQMANGGGCGPYAPVRGAASLDAAQIQLCRDKLRHCANYTDGGWRGNKTDARYSAQLAEWIITQCPALAEEWPIMTAKAREEEDRRRAAMLAKHEIEDTARTTLMEANLWGFDRLLVDGRFTTGPDTYTAQFRAEYHVTGHGPDSLALVIYGKAGVDTATEPCIQHALDVLQLAMPDTEIRCAHPDEYALCMTDRAKLTW